MTGPAARGTGWAYEWRPGYHRRAGFQGTVMWGTGTSRGRRLGTWCGEEHGCVCGVEDSGASEGRGW